jgi:3'-5' exoribonuclease
VSTQNTTPETAEPSSEERIRKIYAKDLKPGESVTTVFKAISRERHASRAGKSYLSISLVDRTGEVDARVFDNVEAAETAFTANDYLLVHGKVGQFHGKTQIVIDRLERLDPGPIDGREFTYARPEPTEPRAPKHEVKEPKDVKPEGAGAKAARQRILRLVENPQVASALDVLITHFEHYIDEQVSARLAGTPRPEKPERRPRGPRIEHKGQTSGPRSPMSTPVDKDSSRPTEPARDPHLPDGLAFKPFNMLVTPTAPSSGGSTEQ